jgi:hypothetical protein
VTSDAAPCVPKQSARRVLVVGSYPPIPLPAAAVSVEAVRAGWHDGATVMVASPRPSAAQLSLGGAGLLVGQRLRRARLASRADDVVLVIEAGFPFSSPKTAGSRHAREWRDRETARRLAGAMREFATRRVVIVGDVGVDNVALDALCAAADDVARRPGGDAPDGVTPLGPREVRAVDRPRWLVGLAFRRALGARAPEVRRALGVGLRRVRSWPVSARRGRRS